MALNIVACTCGDVLVTSPDASILRTTGIDLVMKIWDNEMSAELDADQDVVSVGGDWAIVPNPEDLEVGLRRCCVTTSASTAHSILSEILRPDKGTVTPVKKQGCLLKNSDA